MSLNFLSYVGSQLCFSDAITYYADVGFFGLQSSESWTFRTYGR